MYSIESGRRIATTPTHVARALTTTDGLRGWWTVDVHDHPAGRERTFRFDGAGGPRSIRLRLDHASAARVELTCVGEQRNADWLGTRVAFHLTADGDATRVALVHAGFPARNELYDGCTRGWAHFLASLAAYLETGTGTPFVGATRAVADDVEIAAAPDRVLTALTTAEGVRGWWTQDCDIGPREHTYRFRIDGVASADTFRVDRQDERGLVLTGVAGAAAMGWVGTELAFELTPHAGGTAVALIHAGFARAGGPHEACVRGWRHFLASLKAYVETGVGAPHVPGPAAGQA